MSTAIGIDLGTSNSCVAFMKDGRPVVMQDLDGNNTTPSVFSYADSGEPVVGYKADKLSAGNRTNTIFAVKRLIGRKFSSPEVKEAVGRLPYEVFPSENGDAWVKVHGKSVSPEEVSANVLMRMREVAEEYLNEKIHRAVITVPAHFNDSQRQATRDAGKIAGLEVMRIINEPTAAALAFGLDIVERGDLSKTNAAFKKGVKHADRVIAVFDLGGGTFDISILSIKDGVFDVLATNGDTYLGGEDFDMAILNHLVKDFRAKTGRDLSQDKDALEKLKKAARNAKHQLTDISRVEIALPFVQGVEHLVLTLTRAEMEKIVKPIAKRMEDPCLWAMSDAGLKPEEITDCILVGGMTRMPLVKKICNEIFGQVPLDTIDPDEAVALGAAVQAGLLQGIVKGVSLLDVTSLSLGIEIQGGQMHTIIPRNSKIPIKVTELFTTSAPNQPQVSIHVVQGEDEFAPNNKTLARFELTGVPPAPRGNPDIAVSFEIDPEGIVSVAAKDLQTNKEHTLEIVANSGLSDADLDRMARENRMLEQQMARLKRGNLSMAESAQPEGVDTAVESELKELVFITQTKMNTDGKSFKGRPRGVLEEALNQARVLLESGGTTQDLKLALATIKQAKEPFEAFLDEIIL